MKIKNNMTKVIGIGTSIIRPEDTVDVADTLYGVPSVMALVDKGVISIVECPVAEEKAEEKAVVAEEKAEEKVEAKRKTTKKAE